MFTGTPPFSAPTVAAMLVAHCVRPRPLVSERRPGLPAEIDDVLGRAMAIDPAMRPESGAQLAAQLHEAITGEVAPQRGGGRRPRRRAIAGAVAALVLGTGAVVALATGGNGLGSGPAAPIKATGDKTALNTGEDSRAEIVSLFKLYARNNLPDDKRKFDKRGEPQALQIPRPDGSCDTIKTTDRLDSPVHSWLYFQEQVGAAPIALQKLRASDLRISERQRTISWEGLFRTARRGSGRVRLFAIKDTPAARWRLLFVDHCLGLR